MDRVLDSPICQNGQSVGFPPMEKEMGGKERKDGLILSQLTEQRMIDQMSILDKFYDRYDSQQWGAVLEMELEV